MTADFVRTHQAGAVLESLAGVDGDVLFLLNWAAGPEPLGAVTGRERMLLGFPTDAGTMDGDVVRYRPASFMTCVVHEPSGCAVMPGRSQPGGLTRPDAVIELHRLNGVARRRRVATQTGQWLRFQRNSASVRDTAFDLNERTVVPRPWQARPSQRTEAARPTSRVERTGPASAVVVVRIPLPFVLSRRVPGARRGQEPPSVARFPARRRLADVRLAASPRLRVPGAGRTEGRRRGSHG